MADTQILLPGSVFQLPEIAVTAVPIAMGAGGLMALQSQTNYALLTFNAAHGYTATANANGSTTFANAATGHGPSIAGLTYFQLTGATVNTVVNGVTFAIAAIPSTTTMLVWCTLTGTNPTVTAASFLPVWCLTNGNYNFVLGANCAIQYNPDNTGYPQVAPNTTLTGAVFRALAAVSTSAQLVIDGAGQMIVIASGGAGTSRWSIFPR
jgi:hypothetical protein